MFFNSLCFLIIFLCFCLSVPSTYAADETESANYAFANYLGSGIYRTSGQNATVVNMPFSYQVERDDGIDLKLRLPVSVGFFDFEINDIPDDGIPTTLDTLSFVPGVEFDYLYNDQLTITPYFDLGWAGNLTTGSDTAVYSSGISALYELSGGAFDPLWVNRLYYAGYYTFDANNIEGYAAFQTGFDLGFPNRFDVLGRSIQPTLFAVSYWYFVDLTFDAPGSQDVSISSSYEVGFTFASEKPIGYSFLTLDRLGVGYRFGKDFYAWHLLFDLPI